MTGDHVTFRCGHVAMDVPELNYSLRCPRRCETGYVALLLPATGGCPAATRQERSSVRAFRRVA